MSETELRALDATAQADLVSSGEVSPAELVEAAIRRAEAVNPELNAIVHPLYDEGRETAAGELPDGPFRGVPFLFKDLGAGLAGQPYHMGNRLLKEVAFKMPIDSYLGARFRQAGLVTIGRTNTPEFGILPTTEPESHGAAKNPWDTSRSTGGSSGGSAAAVAAGIVPIAHASDGGGSIRIPASANGLVGLKPSRARVSLAPIVGDSMSGLTTEFCVSKSVRDTARMLDWVHGPQPGDPYGCPEPERPYVDELGHDPGRLNIGVMLEPLTGDELDPEAIEAVRSAATKLEALGHNVSDQDAPGLGGASELYETFITRWAAGMAQNVGVVETIIGRPLTPADVEPLTWALVERGRSESAAQYLAAVAAHQMMARMFAGIYENGVDLILTPVLGTLPPKLGHFDQRSGDPMDAMLKARRFAAFTGGVNATGQPAISVPLEQSSGGLPIGIHLIAPIWREDLLIRLAAQLEQAHPWADRRPAAVAGS
jgi:amidase